jgi:hypothetical protein
MLAAFGLLLSFSERNEPAAGPTPVTMPSTTTLPLLAGGTTIASLGTTLVEAGLPICENATRLAVAGFFEATARGDASEADGYFATDDFEEYTEIPYRTDDEAHRRDTLLEYLQTRGVEGSRLYLVSQQYHGGTGDRLANFGAVALNETDATIWGTGTVNCQSGKIVALYLGAPMPPTSGAEARSLNLTLESGPKCIYQGPDALTSGSITISFDNPMKASAWVHFVRLDEGRSIEEFAEWWDTLLGGGLPSWTSLVWRFEEVEPRTTITEQLDIYGGLYGMVCGTVSPDRGYYAAGLTVKE